MIKNAQFKGLNINNFPPYMISGAMMHDTPCMMQDKPYMMHNPMMPVNADILRQQQYMLYNKNIAQ